LFAGIAEVAVLVQVDPHLPVLVVGAAGELRHQAQAVAATAGDRNRGAGEVRVAAGAGGLAVAAQGHATDPLLAGIAAGGAAVLDRRVGVVADHQEAGGDRTPGTGSVLATHVDHVLAGGQAVGVDGAGQALGLAVEAAVLRLQRHGYGTGFPGRLVDVVLGSGDV